MSTEPDPNCGWTFAASEEGWSHFGGYATAEDAAAHASVEMDLKPGDTFYVGFAVPIDYVDLADSISGLTLIENLQEAAYDKWGYEEAFDDVTTEQGEELEAAFRKTYTDWVAKHGFKPGYYHIESTQKCVVPGVDSPVGGSNAQNVPNEIRELQRPVLRVLGRDEDPDPGAG